jgi:lysophospholipid acyltransferase (LPLAT)-like uncharacterized protein
MRREDGPSQRSAAESAQPSEAEVRRAVYASAPLRRFSLGQRFAIRVVTVAFHSLITLLCSTVRWTVIGWSAHDDVRLAGERFIATFWHDRIVLATWFWRRRGIVVMTSRSFDGEYIARFIQRFGYGAARGSSKRGGAEALDQMAACLAHGIDAGFTIDGPRGPRYVAKRGAVRLAAMSGQPILPFCVAAERAWTIGSWDRLQIPRPFTRAVLFVGEPIRVAPDASTALLAESHDRLQASLDALRERADGWWPDPERPALSAPS